MRVKSCPVSIKAAGDEEGTPEGVFEAIVAAYNIDSGGDRIIPGAFAKTLATWRESGDPIPLYWSHRMDDPDYNIGHVLEAKETDAGLWVKAQIDLEGPKAQQVYRLLKGRRVKQFSFSYDIVKAQPTTDEKSGDEILDLIELELHETGPTPIGMNNTTDLVAIKAAESAERAERDVARLRRELRKSDDPGTTEPDEAAAEESADESDEGKADDTTDEPGDLKARAEDLARAAVALLDALQDQQDPEPSKSEDGKATPAPVEPAALSSDGAKSDESVRPAPGTASDRLNTDLALLMCELESF